jgi:solute carrier family 26 protein
LHLFKYLIGDAFTIAIVSFALNISMSKYFSKKHNYEIDPNQELFSYGMGNFLTSFFEGFPAGGGLTRSLIMESTGAKTQVFSIISSGIVLVVIVGLGFLFRALPHVIIYIQINF